MSGSGSGLLDLGYFKIEGVELLVQKESRSASFGATSLQRADPSFMNSVTGSICRAKG
jgi:hypothetical protein